MTITQQRILAEVRVITAEKIEQKRHPTHVLVIADRLRERSAPHLTLEEFGIELHEMYMQGVIDVGNTINDNWVRSIVIDSKL